MSRINRRFIPQWFDEFDWLEYSVSKDAAFCLYCYLFKTNFEQVGSEAFTGDGFKNWKKGRERFKMHIGPVGSVHNKAREAATNLMNQATHIETAVSKHSDQTRKAYRTCLIASIKCTKFLLRQGFPFRGHDESATSSKRGNYLELLQFLADNNDKVREVVMENASGNLKLLAPSIQKEIVNSCALETLDAIMDGLKDRFFSILVDEARDVSVKEQMAMVLRYVDDNGHVIERFVGIQHVTDTTSSSLKDAIDTLFSRNGLSISKLRGQCYDGASNMRVILGLTNDLSQALQRKDQEIVNAMALVKSCKEKLYWMRNNGFDALVDEVSSFCEKHHIDVPNMEEAFILPGRSRRYAPIKTNRHHYRVELFIYVIDKQITELDDRFNELLRLAQFYPQDFSDEDRLALEDQLEIYIHYVCSSSDFSQLEGIGDLAKKNGGDKDASIATASVERAFSVMNIVKGPLRNKMGDQWLSDSLLVYIERDIFACIENEAIMLRFQNMKPRRGQL
ncbi:unnamed protein product [Malus baccata var. baccata]